MIDTHSRGKTEALRQMDVIAAKLHELEEWQKNLRLEYWRWQAIAYPTNECQHGDNYACKECLPTREDGGCSH